MNYHNCNLELPDYVPLSRSINKRIIYTKNTYQPTVKITDWNYNFSSYPFDVDPLCPGKENHFLSHYHRLGTSDVEELKTTTQEMLEQVYTKDDPKYNIPCRRYLVNYFGYNDTMACDASIEKQFCPELCACDYISTMQDSYTPPYPFVMKRLSIPVPPFLKYRKLHEARPELSSYKFYDEGFVPHVNKLKEHKMQQCNSFNPLTGKYSDGTDGADKVRQCIKLEYDTRENPSKCYSNDVVQDECCHCEPNKQVEQK